VDVLFVPSVGMMYPDGAEVRVVPGRVATRWEGEFRPGHFAGVLTIVAKLFHLTEPDGAWFGQKDFQQATLIRQMVRDLDFRSRSRWCRRCGSRVGSRSAAATPSSRPPIGSRRWD
jgi:pantoate--beta-alanine ligase